MGIQVGQIHNDGFIGVDRELFILIDAENKDTVIDDVGIVFFVIPSQEPFFESSEVLFSQLLMDHCSLLKNDHLLIQPNPQVFKTGGILKRNFLQLIAHMGDDEFRGQYHFIQVETTIQVCK